MRTEIKFEGDIAKRHARTYASVKCMIVRNEKEAQNA